MVHGICTLTDYNTILKEVPHFLDSSSVKTIQKTAQPVMSSQPVFNILNLL